jgi:D-alanyl-lipoteichoic acid acyltransferase DltB (MBOAT superfamily)
MEAALDNAQGAIDVYRKAIPGEPHPGIFACFVTFFPQLVAGPIERAKTLLPQFRNPRPYDSEQFYSGLRRMIWGFFKKVVIADRLAVLVSAVYSNPQEASSLSHLLATYLFAFQIYADFSGYSDIAIGSARILGYDLMENFRQPYFAPSVADFWRRWHISLSTWFRDYVYIPLGGNRVSEARQYLNLFIVFTVSGLWHGADWKFVVWGALHGGYVLAGRLLDRVGIPLDWKRIPRLSRVVNVIITFHLVLLAWIFFCAKSNADAVFVVRSITTDIWSTFGALAAGDASAVQIALRNDFGATRQDLVLVASLIILWLVIDLWREWNPPLDRRIGVRRALFLRMLFYDLMLLGIVVFGVYGQMDFIYFQF